MLRWLCVDQRAFNWRISVNSPGLKKAIERSQKQITEYNHKESEQLKAIQTYKFQFTQACAEFGIEVHDVLKIDVY